MTKSKHTMKRRLGWSGLVAAALAAFFAARGQSFFGGESSEALAGAQVRRGNLLISVTERGNLKARNSISLRSEIEGRTTILWLIPEGTVVEAGEKVAELDASSLVNNRVQQDISVQNADAAYIKAEESLRIQEIQNESDIAKAVQQLEFARIDLEKYLEGDMAQKQKQADEDIKLAEQEEQRAKDKLDWSERLFEREFVQRTEVEADRLAYERASITLERAVRSKDLLHRFDIPKQRAVFDAAVVEAARDLERTKLQAASRLVDFQTAMRTSKSKLDLEREKLEKLERQIEKSVLVAPVAGMIVYGREEGGRMRGDAPVSIGGEVRERQEIISIPGAGGMLAEASIHESVLKQVRVGQPCIVRVDAIPNVEFSGRVTFVAPLPDQNSWWANPNLRVYRSEIAITNPTAEMRPGMSCSIEILIDELKDVLHVPLQAVTNQRGRNLVFVSRREGPEMREVEVGLHNNKWVSIVAGLAEGDTVLLSPPAGFDMRAGEEGDREAPETGTPEEPAAIVPAEFPPAAAFGGSAGGAGAGEGAAGERPRGTRPEGRGERPGGARGPRPGVGGGEGVPRPSTEGAPAVPAAREGS